MVQEYVSPVRVHKYPFEMVMAAYERRFPNCPQIPVVIDCAVTEDTWSSDNSQRNTTRRCQLNVEAPYLLKKMIGVDYIYFLQKNHLDLKNRVLEIDATNETFASRVSVLEKCKYYVHPENPEWTCFEQSAMLDVKNFFGLENTVEKIAMKQYAANIAKGKELIESFMMGVHADNIREINPWTEGDEANNAYLRKLVSRGAEPTSHPAPETRKISQPGPQGKHAMPCPEADLVSSPETLSIKDGVEQKPSPIWQKVLKSKHSISGLHNLPQAATTSKTPSSRSLCPRPPSENSQNKSSLKVSKSKQSSKSKGKISSPTGSKKNLDKKWTKMLSKTRLKKGEPSTSSEEIPENPSLQKLLEFPDSPSLQRLKHLAKNMEEFEREQRNSLNHDSNLGPKDMKPCHCESRTINLGQVFARADNLMMVLVLALAILLMFAAPLTYLMRIFE